MRINPAFDLFEEMCAELADRDESVLTDADFSAATVDALKRWFRDAVTSAAIAKALEYLRKHFEARASSLPFSYDLMTGRLTVLNREYINFVFQAQEQRPSAKLAKDFECATSKQLASRLTGIVRRLGWPRNKHKNRKEFMAYLTSQCHFRNNAMDPRDKDGGLDILWFPPLGPFPFRAMVSIQCKNSLYDRRDALQSVGRAEQTLKRHSYATGEGCHLHCVVFNDYIDEHVIEHARDAGFVPLGLSDLAPLTSRDASLDVL